MKILNKFSYALFIIGFIFVSIILYFEILPFYSQYRMNNYWSKIEAKVGQDSETESSIGLRSTKGKNDIFKKIFKKSRKKFITNRKYLKPERRGRAKNQLGMLIIPRIGVRKVVLYDATQQNLALGPSLIKGTAYPGTLGNAAIAGHRVTHGFPFRNIHKLRKGDEIIFINDFGKFTYYVSNKFRVFPSNTKVLYNTPFAQITLSACDPPYSAKYRLIIVGVAQVKNARIE